MFILLKTLKKKKVMAGGGGVVAEKDPQGVKKEEITLKKDGG